jgi:thiamine kinase-like enzyme
MDRIPKRQIVNYVKSLGAIALGVDTIQDIEIAGLPKGISNFNYRVKVGSKQFVFKISPPNPAEQGILIGNSGRSEFLSLKLVAELGIAPTPILFDDTGQYFQFPVLVYKYVEGTTLSFSDEVMVEVAKIYSKLHALDITNVQFLDIRIENPDALLTDIEKRFAIYQGRDDVPPQKIKRFRRYIDLAKAHVATAPLETCPLAIIHADPVPSNLIVGPKVFLIDWQATAIGDPAYDIWAFTSEAFTLWDADTPPTEAQKTLFRRTYLTLNDDLTLERRITIKEPLYLLQYGLHCSIRYHDYRSSIIPAERVAGREANFEKFGRATEIILDQLHEIL